MPSASTVLSSGDCVDEVEVRRLEPEDIARTADAIELGNAYEILFVDVNDPIQATRLATDGARTDLLKGMVENGVQAAQPHDGGVLFFFRTGEGLQSGACMFDDQLREKWSITAVGLAIVV
jgi:hypothetical protein